MNLSWPFIARPVATTLMTLGVALAGFLAYFQLPVAPLPQVEFPTISVQASLPGASPETMAATVATPLERALGAIGATGDELISFLTYLCWRWRTAKSQVRDAVAAEYKRQIGLTIRMARHAFYMDVKSLAFEVGGNNPEHVFPE